MRNKDYYKTLQVDPSAESEVIAAAYKRLSLMYHPDMNKSPDATLRMQEMNEAYEVLSNPEKRREYDKVRVVEAAQHGTPRADRRQEPGTRSAHEYAQRQQEQQERAESKRRQEEFERQQKERQEAEQRRRQAEQRQRRGASLKRLVRFLLVGASLLAVGIAILWIANILSSTQSTAQPVIAPATPIADSTPSLRSELMDLLPDAKDLPSDLRLIEGRIVSNDEVAFPDTDPAAMLELVQSWGRVAGYQRQYTKALGCESQGIREIQVMAIRYKTSGGAQQFVDWARKFDQAHSDHQKDIGIGDYGYQFWFDSESNYCESLSAERVAAILFRRENDLGSVYVYAAKGALTDDDLMTQALKLAEIIDNKLANKAPN